LQLTANAVSSSSITFKFGANTYSPSIKAGKTIYGIWTIYGFAQDNTTSVYYYGSNSILISNTITVNPSTTTSSTTTIAQGPPFTGGLPGPRAPTIVTTVTSTTTPTTTILPSIFVNKSYTISKTTPTIVNLSGNKGMGVSISLSSLNSGSATLKITNVTNPTNIPKSYISLETLNISTVSSSNVTIKVTLNYSCSLNQNTLAPYKQHADGSWKPILNFTVNSAKCSISFVIPPDPIVALLQYQAPSTTTITTTPTTAATTSVATTTAQQVQKTSGNSNALLIAIAIVIIIAVIAAIYYLSKRGKK
jgi:flagellar basal body-associated protein FliL